MPGLDQNGWANAYYSAAVQAASRSWTSFWFASADMGDFVSIDKPPLSIWAMALSARIFGFNAWSMLIPESLMGVGTVLLVYAICRSFLPSVYALFGGAAVAVMPVATLMFRYNNPDALLVLLMTICAWSSLRMLRKPSFRWSLLVGASVGLGFMTKQLQVFLIVPAAALCLLGSVRLSWPAKIKHAATAAAAALVTGVTWFVAVSLVPSGSRPYIGGSRTNSIWELTLGYNGLDRLTGQDAVRTTGSPTGEGAPATGFIRFIYPNYAGQVSWLLPLVLVATACMLVMVFRRNARSVPAPVVFAALWWWTSVPILAYMGGIVHPYYSLVIVPPTAILAAWAMKTGISPGTKLGTRGLVGAGLLGALLVNIVIMGLYTPGYGQLLSAIIIAGAVACAGVVINTPPPTISGAMRGLAVVALLTGPSVWSVATALTGHAGSSPSAGPSSIIGVLDSPNSEGLAPSMSPANESVVLGVLPDRDLTSHIQSASESRNWGAATVGGQNAALAALASASPVLPLGGFDGSDPAPTLEVFQHLVAEGRIGGLVLGALPSGAGAGTESQRIVDWVERHYSGDTYGSLTYYSFTETR
ncbi:glycosyltransferase family 39 protein [Sinomonas gamaensis]|uniref:glycosyltransferase family 39 protein n=1 Tax=Sinomonas gamaensis TaxID=2565624 RepID=UPI0014868375|nr:glycosyltransferase family 39 protein [Sinomonas gamaensis]